MYPNLYFLFKHFFGDSTPNFLKYINSFGFIMALSFVCAAVVLTSELKRKAKLGWFTPLNESIMVGKPAGIGELLTQFFIGFLMGYKFLGLFIDKPTDMNPQEYIMSSQGNWLMGIGLGALMAGLRWYDANKQKLATPEKRVIRVWPKDRVGDLTMLAALFGFLGAKLFHNLENVDQLMADPIEALTSFSGLTFYGGLICAGVAIIIYLRKKQISLRPFLDAIAPGLILAYAVGRIGCQVSGDGDWGVYNSAYKLDTATNKVVPAQPADFDSALVKHGDALMRTHDFITSANDYKRSDFNQFKAQKLATIGKRSFKAPSFLPTWMVAYTYPNNVVNSGIPINGSNYYDYNNQLPIPAFPTPFYETVMGLIIFITLMALRKSIKRKAAYLRYT
jgi:phosphatidylglycerol---prolipoprotein diacylglyceryl transferase